MALLTPEEMQTVTGAVTASKQIAVLEDNRIGYIRRIDGKPTTTWEAINAKLTSGQSLSAPGTANDGFNLGAIN